MSSADDNSPERALTPFELRSRVIFSLLMPAARVALGSELALKEMKRLVELSLYREARRKKLKMKDISRLMSVSMSKVGLLSRDIKAHFAEPEEAHGMARRILTLLWAGPLSQARIVTALGAEEEAEAVSEALERLVAQKRLEVEPGRSVDRYKLGAPQHRLVHDPWMARVDALDNLLSSLIKAVEARFFEGDPRAFARTLDFRVRPEDLPRLQRHYEELFALVCELDEAAVENPDGDPSLPMQLSLLWAPDNDFPDDDGDDHDDP